MIFRILGLLVTIGMMAGCADGPTETSLEEKITSLTSAIIALGPNVDPAEASRAAEIAYSYTADLAVAYEITDPPLIHNTKVNLGLRPRGLCWHWAQDIEARLNEEAFETLTMHRAIANAFHPILIEHSTAIIAAAGDEWDEGIVLDSWRYGGVLFWDGVAQDTRYPWEPRDEVNAKRWASAR